MLESMKNELAMRVEFNKGLLKKSAETILLRMKESGVSGLPAARDVLALEVKERETARMEALLRNLMGERVRTEAQVIADLREELARISRSALRSIANGSEEDLSGRADAAYAEALLATFRELR